MAINKVIYGDNTLMDLTGDTVSSNTLLYGAVAHNAAGEEITGSIIVPEPASNLPADLGTAAVGTSEKFAREDHVHSKPSYSKSDVGLGNVDNVQQYSVNNPPPYPVTSVNGNTGAVTIPDEIYIGTTTPTDSGVDVWIDTGSSGTLQNVVCSVNGISPTSGGNVDLIPAERPTYYIDGTNGSDSNDGSQSHPFATINKALDLIKEYKIQNIYPAIVYIAEGTYDEFLDLKRLALELNINLQGDVTISGILCVYSTCFINGNNYKLTVQNSSNVTYPWGKMLICVSQGSDFDIKSGSSGSVELKTTDNNFTGISVTRESNFYIQKAVFTTTFSYPINIENTEAKIGSIVSSGTNIGRLRDSGTLFLGDINGGVSYTGTTIDGTSRIIFKGTITQPTAATVFQLGAGASTVTSFSTGIYDPNNSTVRLYLVARSSSNIAGATVLATIPEAYRPVENTAIYGMMSTASARGVAFYGVAGANGNITQSLGNECREVFLCGEYVI